MKKGDVSRVERGGLVLDFRGREDLAGVEDWEAMFCYVVRVLMGVDGAPSSRIGLLKLGRAALR